MSQDYKIDISEVLHDVTNQLQVLYGMIFVNKQRLDKNYGKITSLLLSIGKNVNNISLSTVQDVKVNKKIMNSKSFVMEIQGILKDFSDVYVSSVIECDLFKNDAIVYFNELLVKQLILNIYDNSRKAKSDNMYISIHDKSDSILLEFRDHGEQYESSMDTTYFHGVGLKTIQRICDFLEYEFRTRKTSDSFLVSLKILKQKSLV